MVPRLASTGVEEFPPEVSRRIKCLVGNCKFQRFTDQLIFRVFIRKDSNIRADKFRLLPDFRIHFAYSVLDIWYPAQEVQDNLCPGMFCFMDCRSAGGAIRSHLRCGRVDCHCAMVH